MHLIVWALLTGLVTGGSWMGIVLMRQQRELDRYEPEQLELLRGCLAELAETNARMAELEQRLERAERLLARPDERM